MPTVSYRIPEILEKLHIEPVNSGACYGDWIAEPSGGEMESLNPATGEPLARIKLAGPADYECVMAHAAEAFLEWRMVPAPQRGDVVREIAGELRAHKADLGALVTLEMGKILPEGLGEVQEMIDIADFAAGLSRQLYGLTMHSERPGHRHCCESDEEAQGRACQTLRGRSFYFAHTFLPYHRTTCGLRHK